MAFSNYSLVCYLVSFLSMSVIISFYFLFAVIRRIKLHIIHVTRSRQNQFKLDYVFTDEENLIDVVNYEGKSDHVVLT